MTVGYREAVRRTTTRKKRNSALLFFWVILILAQFGTLFATPEDDIISGGRSVRYHSPARKVLRATAVVFETVVSIDAAPASSPSNHEQYMNGDADKELYGDDKRRIHTGPNPLHN